MRCIPRSSTGVSKLIERDQRVCFSVAKRQWIGYTDGMSKILNTLRRAIETTDETRYSIARGSGVNASQLCRFVSGERGLSIESAETLADYIGLEIIIRPRRGRKGR